MRKILILLMSVICLVLVVNIAFAYEQISVTNGGSISGVVKVAGTVAADDATAIDMNKEDCGDTQKADKYIITGSKVANVVVWLDQVQKGKPLIKGTYPIVINKCKISPLVGVAYTGGEFTFSNEDKILHTLQLKSGLNFHKKLSSRPLKNGATVLNLALPKSAAEVKHTIPSYFKISNDRGYISILSNTHSFMRGYVFVFDHPYAVVTDNAGAFAISDVPAGDYTLKIWHEGFGVMEKKITVKAGTKVISDFIYQTGVEAGI